MKNNYLNPVIAVLIFCFVQLALICNIAAVEKTIARFSLTEPAGLTREVTYVEIPVQAEIDPAVQDIVVIDEQTPMPIPCQVFDIRATKHDIIHSFRIIFPIALKANETKIVSINAVDSKITQFESDLKITGIGLDLQIENEFFKADLRTLPEPEPKSHHSGQIRELVIKMGFNQLLTNTEDRVHWAPNFKRPELEYYTTIAHWESPKYYETDTGPYLIQTKRQDSAPDHLEILLTAVYRFYAKLPYFRFYSSMRMVDDVWLELLRNDEMTMDSMFTHLAFQRPSGEIVDVKIEDRHDVLAARPIEDNADWLCFYHIKKGFAFGTIRLKYDNTNAFGEESPTYLPHTQIGQWLDRRYWNRRLIHDHLTFVPRGSRYVEENAYIVFKIDQHDTFKSIKTWDKQLRNPIRIARVQEK